MITPNRGGYFITICTYQRGCLLGEIIDSESVKPRGEYRSTCLGMIYLTIILMWNWINFALCRICSWDYHFDRFTPAYGRDLSRGGSETRPTRRGKRHGLPEIVRAFKSFSSRRINEIVGFAVYSTWQRNYYDHIIRNDRELTQSGITSSLIL